MVSGDGPDTGKMHEVFTCYLKAAFRFMFRTGVEYRHEEADVRGQQTAIVCRSF